MTEQEIDLMKLNIETQLDEYARAIADYAEFMRGWRARNRPDDLIDAEPVQ